MRVRIGAVVVNELGAPLRDVRRQAGDPLPIVELAVPFGDRFVPVAGEGPFGEGIVPETRDTTSAAAFGRASRRTACRIRSNRSLSDRRESIL